MIFLSNILNDFEKWILQSVVISAMRSKEFNTTDNLINIWNELWEFKKFSKIQKMIEEIKQFHFDLAKQKIKDKNILNNLYLILNQIFTNFENIIWEWILKWDKSILPWKNNDYTISINWKSYSIIWFWEQVSAKVFSTVLNSKAKTLNIINNSKQFSEGLYLDDIIGVDEINWKSEKEVFKLLYNKLWKYIWNILNSWKIPILSWYVGKFEKGIENTIWRGYSDSVASALAVWLAWDQQKEIILEIQKKVLWILSCEPNLLEKPEDAKLIENINYITAREITGARWANAKVLHNQTLREELLSAWIKIHVFDPFDKESKWTWITPKWDILNEWIQFVWWKKNITLITISVANMCQWFLAKVFDIIKDFASVDIVSTSETEVTISLNEWNNVEKIKEILEKKLDINNLNDEYGMNFVKIEKDKALIYCVWQNIKDRVWILSKATNILSKKWINIEIVSQWYLQRAMTFGVAWEHYKKAIQCLHNAL